MRALRGKPAPLLGQARQGGGRLPERGAGTGGDMSKKLHLHARSLTVEHPVTKELLTFTAPLPEHMQRTWSLLDWKEADVPADPFVHRK